MLVIGSVGAVSAAVGGCGAAGNAMGVGQGRYTSNKVSDPVGANVKLVLGVV